MTIPIDQPGIYQMSAADYHADCCPSPSLSSSLARVLLSCSAHHAWWQHPKLNLSFQAGDDERFDVGTAAHAFLLEGIETFVVIEADDYRTKAAQETRALAKRAGKMPLLAKQWDTVRGMIGTTKRQLDEFQEPPRPFSQGDPETTLIWREGTVWCRARLDWLHADRTVVDDYKTTHGSANPDVYTRALFGMGLDVQAAFYCRGIKALTGVEPRFRFIVQEARPPYALSVIALGPAAMTLAQKKVAFAIEQWAYCLEHDLWPGYPTRTAYADLPGWHEAQWLEREVRDDGSSLTDQLYGGAA